jgi:uncharacterized protein YvpB
MGLIVAALWLGSGEAGESAVLFDVPFRSQLDGAPYALSNCGPTALAMALAYYGVDASTWDVRVRAMIAQHSWVGDDGGYSDRYGVFVYNLAAVAEGYGLHVGGLWSYEAGHPDHLRQWQPLDLRRELAAGRPVIVDVHYRALPAHHGSHANDDHYIVVHGFRGDDFIYSDPMGTDPTAADVRISSADLLAAMDQTQTPRAGFAVAKGS